MKSLLQSPAIYQLFQIGVGAFSARVKVLYQYLDPRPGQRLIDIGCGPGHILTKLPEGVIYDGFDVDETYIQFANRHFGNRGQFHCRLFDEAAASEFGPADIVMMNGVLHHLDDDSARATVSTIKKVLKPGGAFFALDGVYSSGQSAIAKWFLDNDRGKFVRTEAAHRAILATSFPTCELYVHHDLLRIPYSLIVAKCNKGLIN
jgi:SAM-dependent methyltransferase